MPHSVESHILCQRTAYISLVLLMSPRLKQPPKQPPFKHAHLQPCPCVQVFTHYHERQEWDWRRLVGSGGMPSSHTAFVLGLTTAIGVKEGTAAPLFALCLVFSLVVAYDACGVRLHAGRQAAVLNLIVSELPPDHPLQDSGKLHDTLGHTPVQVGMLISAGFNSIGWVGYCRMGMISSLRYWKGICHNFISY